MARLGDLIVNVGANVKDFNKKLGQVNREVGRTTGNISKLGRQISLGVTLPVAALGVTAVRAFDQQAKAIAQVEAGLKSTGSQVGFTSKQLQQMASDLQSTTLFGDEEILKGATAQLLTFTNISGQQFARTQKAALDLATRLDGDLKGASIQLGKALNDPIANLSALSRSGIQFSEDQKAVIKSLTETGRLAEAQTLILDELEKQYGGSAEAAAKAGTGGLKQLQNSFGDLQEEFGKVIVDMMPPFIEGAKNIVSAFASMSSGMKTGIVVIAGVAAAIGPILMLLPQMVAGFGMLKVAMLQGVIPAFQRMTAVMLANPWIAAAAAVAALGAAYMVFRDKTTAAEQAQRDLDEALAGAEQSAAKNMVKIDLLARAVADETMEEDKRIAALNELARISPDHFGNLDLEAAKTGQLAQSVKTYREEMVRAAKAKAFQGQLEEQVAVMIELENKLKEQEKLYKDIVQQAGAQSGPAEGVLDTMLRISEQLAEQDKVVQAVTDRMAEVSDVSDLITASVQNTTAAVVEQTAAVQSLGEAYAGARQNTGGPMELMATSAAPTGVDTGMGERGLAMPIMPEEGMEEASMGLQAYNEQLNNTLALSSQIGDSMGGMFGSMVEGSMTAQEAMKNMAKSVLKSLIGVARANAVAVFSSPTNPANLASGGLAMPAVIAGGLALVESLLGAVAFADGGIVSGPTLGLVGEYSGARSNPEVIAPLDKLQSMIGGGGSQKVVVEGRIQGTDIVMANERGSKNLDRSRSRTR